VFENAGANDYHLRDGSPAIDTGAAGFQSVAAPAADCEGNARPRGGGYDIGAYESGISVPADRTAPGTPTGLTVTQRRRINRFIPDSVSGFLCMLAGASAGCAEKITRLVEGDR
jgi:hypothetical protein